MIYSSLKIGPNGGIIADMDMPDMPRFKQAAAEKGGQLPMELRRADIKRKADRGIACRQFLHMTQGAAMDADAVFRRQRQAVPSGGFQQVAGQLSSEDVMIVTGSLYFISEVRHLFDD